MVHHKTFHLTRMLKLIDLIRLAEVPLEKFKIHCATGVNPTPLDDFYEGESHAMNFLFTILEVIDLNASKDNVIARESHWKRKSTQSPTDGAVPVSMWSTTLPTETCKA